MREEPKIIKELREEERIGLFSSSSELEQILPGEANDEMQEELYSSMDTSEDLDLEGNDDELLFEDADEEARLILDEVSDLVLFLDLKGKILDINKAGLEFSGFERKEVIGKYFWRITGVFSKKNIPKYMKVFKDALKGKKTKDFTASLKDKNGKKHVMTFSVFPKKINGKIKHITVVSKDITELEIIKGHYDLISQNTSDMISIVSFSANPEITYVSPSHKECLGYDVKELIGKKFFDFIHPDDKKNLSNLVKRYIANKAKKILTGKEEKISERLEYRISDKKGNWHYFETTANLAEGNIIAISRDVTEKKEVEKKIKQSQENYETIFNSSTDSVFIHDFKNGKIIDVNKCVLDKFGYTKEEIKNLNVGNLSINEPPYTQKDAAEWIKKAATEGTQKFEWLAKTKKGELIWYENVLQKVNISGEERVLVIGRDITNRKKIMEELTEKEEVFRRIVETAPSMLLITDEKGSPVYISPNSKEFTGYDPGDYYKEIKWWAHPDDIQEAKRRFKNTFKNHNSDSFTYKAIKKNGDVWYASSSWMPLKNQKGDFDGIVMQTIDITDKAKAEEKLKESERRLKDAEKTAKIGYVEWNCEQQKAIWSDTVFELYERDKELGTPPYDEIMAFHGPEDAKKRLEEAVTLAITKGISYDFDLKVNLPSGKTAYHHVIGNPVKNKEGKVTKILGTVQDITERKKTQEALKESEEKYRELFNNALVGIDIHNSDGSVFAVNKTAENIFGLSEEELKKKDLSFWKGKLIKPDGAPMESKDFPLSIVAETKKPSEGLIVGLKMSEKDEPRWFLHSARPLLDKNGEIDKVVTSFVEITDKKITEKKYRDLFEKMDQGVVYQNSDGKIISANPAAEKILGLSFDQMIERTSMDPRWKAVDENKNELPGEKHPAMMVLKTGKKITNFIQGIYNPKISDYVWIIINSIPQFKNGSNKPYQVFSTFLDITDRVKTEEKLKKREELLNFAIKQTTVPVIIAKAPDAEIIHYNKAAYELLQKKPKDVKDITLEKHREFWPTFHPDGSPYDIDDLPLTKAVKRGIITKDEKIVVKKDGEEHWISASAAPLVDKEGEVLAGIVVFPEITEQKEIERELKESEEKYRNMIELSPDGIATADLKGTVTSVNKSFLDITGFSKEEIVGKHVSRLPTINFKDFPNYMKVYKDILLGKQKEPFVFRWKHKNGELRWGECRHTIMKKEGKKVGIQVVLRDITEQRKHDEEIRKFKTISDKAQYGVNLLKMDGATVYVNDAFAEMHGYKKEELIGKNHDILHIEEEISSTIKDSREKLKKGEHVFVEETHKKKDGSLIPVQVNASAIPDNDGKPMLIAGIVSNLSKQKELTQKLKESENLFRTLIEQSSSGVYIHDPVKNKLFYANPLIRKILKIKEEDIEKTNLFEYLHPDDAKLIKERTRKRLAGEKIDPSVEIRIYPPGKKEMWIKAYTTFIKYRGVTAALASVIDITESKEARLKEKEHLEELQRYKDATIGREMRVIELKREVNKICKEQGLSLKYKDIENEIKKYEEEP